MSYNIHRAIGLDRRFRPERIVGIVAHHAPDLLLLQEVDDGAPRSSHLDLAKELADWLGFAHFAVGHNVTLRRGRYGNATLSRFPIARERNIDLTIPLRKRRGCQHTSIVVETRAGERQIEIFNLHLGLSARERAHQLGTLTRSPEFAGLDPHVPCLVGGDFNDWRSRLQPVFTEILGFRCATERRSNREGAIRTYPSFSPTGGLDRLYFRGRVRLLSARSCRLRLSRVASDHLPILADFDLLPPRHAQDGAETSEDGAGSIVSAGRPEP
jgi:endonuclease/exonuclease/phosphatase family metal-dependent hydrolase